MIAGNRESKLSKLLAGSEFDPAISGLHLAAESILVDNAMPFFPAYTNHGADHVALVTAAVEGLIPEDVWQADLLRPVDAAALIGAALLHDLGMHIHERGFAELVAPATRFMPLPYFDEPHGARLPDAPWPELWKAFQREARHFGVGQLDALLGPAHNGVPSVAFTDEIDPTALTELDRLLIGEFLRRHHARLSHEIAAFGFPGAAEAFPILSETAPHVGDLIGAIARSHGEDLRFMIGYLHDLEGGNRRPLGVAAAYHMALLRIADYLQIDSRRAPRVLLRLKSPQSRISVEEWEKHAAVPSVSPSHGDPFAIAVSVTSDHSLRTHLALRDLLAALQTELDTTWAVLDEHYGPTSLGALRLAYRRVVSNIDEPGLHKRMPYVPRHAALRSDPDLFRLLVRDLYGDSFYVAGRELVQNAADAVRARRLWERSNSGVADAEFIQQEADIVVIVDRLEEDDGTFVLRVSDRGIGMSPDRVIESYLKAGASYGPSPLELDGMSDRDAVAVMKAGRFGVGAFAAFLLGPEVRVATRHIDERRGVRFRAHIDEDLVQLDWADLPIGTTVEVPMDAAILRDYASPRFFAGMIARSYRLSTPTMVVTGGGREVPVPADVPTPSSEAITDDGWLEIPDAGLEAAYWRPVEPTWSYDDVDDDDDETALPHFSLGRRSIVHNGIVIERLYAEPETEGYRWSKRVGLNEPAVAIFDPQQKVDLSLQRYELVSRLPFEPELLDSIGTDLAVYALVSGRGDHPLLHQGHNATLRSPIYRPDGFVPALWELAPAGRELHCVGWYPAMERVLSAEGEPTRLRYLSNESAVEWPSDVHRAVGGPISQAPFTHQVTTLEQALRHVRQAGLSFGSALGGGDVRTIVVARSLDDGVWTGERAGEFTRSRWDLPEGGEWRHLATVGRNTEAHIFLVGDHGCEVRPGEVKAAASLSRTLDWSCLTIVRGQAPRDGHTGVAEAWRRYIDGVIPHDRGDRDRLANEIERRFPETHQHFRYWRHRLGDGEPGAGRT